VPNNFGRIYKVVYIFIILRSVTLVLNCMIFLWLICWK